LGLAHAPCFAQSEFVKNETLAEKFADLSSLLVTLRPNSNE
jgi:hypothetical protein